MPHWGLSLKALGLSIWGLIAFGLLIIFILVGYQAGLKFRSSGVPGEPTQSVSAVSGGRPAFAPTAPEPRKSIPPSFNSDATRRLLREAADQHEYGTVLEYGKQLFDSGSAGPDDLVIVAHAFYSADDCENARVWVNRAEEAFQAAAQTPDQSLDRIRIRCGSDNHRKSPPQLDTDLAKGKSGDRFVRLGELYYGFGDYQQAILFIQRGLEAGPVTHLDDAYVYLGLSELAIQNTAEACRVLSDHLESVPDINPRTLKLWELFADTRC